MANLIPHPINDCVLVRLDNSTYKTIAATEKKYDSRTTGVAIAMADSVVEDLSVGGLEGKRVWFAEYKDDVRVERDGATYAFIKYEDIRGYDDQTS